MASYCDLRWFQYYYTILNTFSYPTPTEKNSVHRETPYDECLFPPAIQYTLLLCYHSRAESSLGGRYGVRRRPRSTPAGVRAQKEAASTVFDRRPPWSLPLDSVFAPRVAGAVQVGGRYVQNGGSLHAEGSFLFCGFPSGFHWFSFLFSFGGCL